MQAYAQTETWSIADKAFRIRIWSVECNPWLIVNPQRGNDITIAEQNLFDQVQFRLLAASTPQNNGVSDST